MSRPPRQPPANSAAADSVVDLRQVWYCLYVFSQDPRRYGLDRCILCDRKAISTCFFMPYARTDIALLIGQPENKTRTIFYGLCQRCRSLPEQERNRRVEEAIRESHSNYGPEEVQ